MAKYLLVIDQIGTGGAEKLMMDFQQYLLSKDEQVLIFALYCKDISLRLPNVEYGFVGENAANPMRKFAQQRLLKRNLQCQVNEYQPDRIFSFLERSNVLVQKLHTRAQRVISVHNVLSIQYNKIGNPLIRFVAKNVITRAYNSNNTPIVAVSAQVKEDLVKNFGVDASNIHVVNNRVNTSAILRMANEEVTEFSFDKQTQYLINVGRFTLQKAQWKLIKAVKILQTERPNNNIHLIMLGEGEFVDPAKSLVNILDLGDKITILPFNKNPYKFMAKASWVVMPSLYEGFPITIAEAIALGLPFAGSVKAIPGEVFEPNSDIYTQITYDNVSLDADFTGSISGDDTKLATLIAKICDNSQFEELVIDGYKQWAENNSKEEQFNEYIKLYTPK